MPAPAPLLLPIALYCIVTSITPGPNNLMLLSSGVRFGVRRSLAHMLGISVGCVFMLAMTGLGLASVFAQYPVLQQALQVVGMAYLLWLAWQMTRAPAPVEPPAPNASTDAATLSATTPRTPTEASRPLGFWGAAAFQWVNPKLWVMALGLFTTYMPGSQSVSAVLVASALFGVLNFPCIAVWAVAGQQLRHWLQNPKALRLFNWSMALLLLASMLPVLLQQ